MTGCYRHFVLQDLYHKITIGVQIEVFQKVIGICLANVAPIQVQGEESQTSPGGDPPIDRPDDFLL